MSFAAPNYACALPLHWRGQGSVLRRPPERAGSIEPAPSLANRNGLYWRPQLARHPVDEEVGARTSYRHSQPLAGAGRWHQHARVLHLLSTVGESAVDHGVDRVGAVVGDVENR